MRIVGIDHVQIAIPRGSEDEARTFYVNALGMQELPKPPILAVRGGLWLECGNQQLHLGVEDDFRAAKKAHPALLVMGLRDLTERLRIAGIDVVEDDLLPDQFRAYVADPFGNRLELIDAKD